MKEGKIFLVGNKEERKTILEKEMSMKKGFRKREKESIQLPIYFLTDFDLEELNFLSSQPSAYNNDAIYI